MDTVLRILHVGNMGWFQEGIYYYAMDRKIANGLIRLGHNVYNWSHREQVRGLSPFHTTGDFFARKKMNLSLMRTVEQYRPHILFLGHSELVTRQTLVSIRERFPEIRIAQWWVDPLVDVAHIRERMDLLDVFFATSGKSALVKAFGAAYADKLFFFPNISDRSTEVGCAFKNFSPAYDLVFVGRATPDRTDLMNRLKLACPYLRIGHFGHSPETMVFGASYMEVLQQSRMGLSYNRLNDVPFYTSDRLTQLTGNGLLVFSPKVPGLERLFSDEELVYYDDTDALVQKILYFHENPEEGRRIAEQGWKRAHSSYAGERVGRFLLETIFEQPYTEPYEWVDA